MKRYLKAIGLIVVVILFVLGLRLLYYSVFKTFENREASLPIKGKSVSGIFPHMSLYNANHADEKPGETGIGGVVPWGDKLYAITYSAHRPKGSSDQLYVIDKKGKVESHPLSIGGTPANRMIHRESRQLIIGPYFIKENGDVRVVPISDMPGRLTATARHLTDPKNKVYFYTMEEGLYEVDVYTLEVKEIYQDGNMRTPPDVAGPMLPGYHGKGAYSGQDRLVVANNGEYHWQTTDESGCLAEWDGNSWKVIERKQFTEVTGPGGLYGNAKKDDPIWSTGWDQKSLILKVREQGNWQTYRLPKASYTYDGQHGWHTEWPRIRDIGMDKWLMTMHGMFWAFPPDFGRGQTSGIRPHSSYLKIIPDFARWQSWLVMGSDDASMFDNALMGQPHSNFWFIQTDELDDFGPRNAYGNLWLNEDAEALEESDPFLVGGFDQFMLAASHAGTEAIHLKLEKQSTGSSNWDLWQEIVVQPGSDPYTILSIPEDTEWIRIISTDGLIGLSVHIHLTQKKGWESNPSLFAALPDMGSDNIRGGLLRPNGDNGDLAIFGTGETQYYQLNEKLKFSTTPYTEEALEIKSNLIPKRGLIGADTASLFYRDKHGEKWRMPWGTGTYDSWYARYPQRVVREVATERSLLNLGGLFYELPRDISGGIQKIKPIATHNKMIIDFCSWRGMLVLSGTKLSAEEDGHFVEDDRYNSGLWLGTIDDLWKFGKPTGMGGPWYNNQVKAGDWSDPYLMLGFDQKSLYLHHDGTENIKFVLAADFTGDGIFTPIKTISVPSNEGFSMDFPQGFSAHWVRLMAEKECAVTAVFNYQ